jgi:hypothetical protein
MCFHHKTRNYGIVALILCIITNVLYEDFLFLDGPEQNIEMLVEVQRVEEEK